MWVDGRGLIIVGTQRHAFAQANGELVISPAAPPQKGLLACTEGVLVNCECSTI